jgi:hypothetical protein
MDEITLLDVVALMNDIPVEGLRRGQVGTVVEQWEDRVFGVEFSDNSGEAYAFAALDADQRGFIFEPENRLNEGMKELSSGTPKAFDKIAQGRARSATPWEPFPYKVSRDPSRVARRWLVNCYSGRCPGLSYFTPLA